MKIEETLSILDALRNHIDAKKFELEHKLTAEQSCPRRSYYNTGELELGELTRYLTFGDGSMVKYLFRAGEKDELETDLMKAKFYYDCRAEQHLHSLPVPTATLDRFEHLMHQKPWFSQNAELVDNVIAYLRTSASAQVDAPEL